MNSIEVLGILEKYVSKENCKLLAEELSRIQDVDWNLVSNLCEVGEPKTFPDDQMKEEEAHLDGYDEGKEEEAHLEGKEEGYKLGKEEGLKEGYDACKIDDKERWDSHGKV